MLLLIPVPCNACSFMDDDICSQVMCSCSFSCMPALIRRAEIVGPQLHSEYTILRPAFNSRTLIAMGSRIASSMLSANIVHSMSLVRVTSLSSLVRMTYASPGVTRGGISSKTSTHLVFLGHALHISTSSTNFSP